MKAARSSRTGSFFHSALATLLAALLLVPAWPTRSWAGSLGKSLFRGAAKSVARSARRKSLRSVLRRDLARHRRAVIRPARRARRVFRYTGRHQAQSEVRRGIGRGRHMTSRAHRGRPLGARRAMRRYGLPKKPQVRETVRIPKGHPIRVGKALGGARGVGELTSPKRIPPSAIERVVPLR